MSSTLWCVDKLEEKIHPRRSFLSSLALSRRTFSAGEEGGAFAPIAPPCLRTWTSKEHLLTLYFTNPYNQWNIDMIIVRQFDTKPFPLTFTKPAWENRAFWKINTFQIIYCSCCLKLEATSHFTWSPPHPRRRPSTPRAVHTCYQFFPAIFNMADEHLLVEPSFDLLDRS